MAGGGVTLVWVGTECYRKREIVYPPLGEGEEEEEEEEGPAEAGDDEPPCGAGLEGVGGGGDGPDEPPVPGEPVVRRAKSGGWSASFPVPSDFRSGIIGRAGAVKKRFEAETGTRIAIPDKGRSGPVVVSGPSRDAVAGCANRLLLKVEKQRSEAPFTHFVSVPLTTSEVVERLGALRAAAEGLGAEAEAFVSPARLHLTLGTLTLAEEELGEARDAFQAAVRLASAVLPKGRRRFRLQGLEIMNDDPSAVDVLYAKVVSAEGGPAEEVRAFGEALRAELWRRCPFARDDLPLKLHATLINSKISAKQGSARSTFDATAVLRELGSWDFGEVELGCVHLSARLGAPRDAYYAAAAVAHLV